MQLSLVALVPNIMGPQKGQRSCSQQGLSQNVRLNTDEMSRRDVQFGLDRRGYSQENARTSVIDYLIVA